MTKEERRALVEARDPAKVRASDRRRYYRDPAKRKAAQARYREQNAERMNALRTRDAARNPERRRVYKIVQRALASGRLIRPVDCQECGAEDVAVHAHHNDYAKPLEVEWLCVDCHGRRHRQHEDDR